MIRHRKELKKIREGHLITEKIKKLQIRQRGGRKMT
jgi:hypothetical protein